MEQEIKEIKRQLQCIQHQNDDLNDRLFTLANLKYKDSSASFYSGFPDWQNFMVVYTYLDPGEKGEIMSYWHSTNPGVFSDYTLENKVDEYLTKKGRARSLRPQDEFLMGMCRLREGFHEDHLAHLCNVSTCTGSRIFITWINFMYFKFGPINIGK